MKKLVVLVCLLVFAGCSSVQHIGTIGEKYELYKVTTRDFIAPSTQNVLTYDTESRDLVESPGVGGNSVLGTVLAPAATAYAGHQIGRGLADSGDTITEENNISSVSEGSTATGGEVGDVYGGYANSSAQGGQGGYSRVDTNVENNVKASSSSRSLSSAKSSSKSQATIKSPKYPKHKKHK